MASTAAERRGPWPWHRRLAARYAATLTAVALGSTLLLSVPLYVVAARLLEQALDERLEGTAELGALLLGPASDGLEQADLRDPALARRLSVLREEADLDAMYVLTPTGDVLVAAGLGPVLLTQADRAAMEEATQEDSAATPIQVDANGARFLTAYAPTAGHALLGVRASAPYLERLDALRATFAAAALAWGGVVALLGGVLGARLTRPIQRLLDATDQLSAGGVPAPPEPGGAAELDSLQQAFADMAGAINRRERWLRALAGAVAHEVRNPSNALRLHLGLLRRDLGSATGAILGRVGVLERELDALDATVDGFLVFARDRAARREPTGLRALLERVADGALVSCPDIDVNVDGLLLGRAVGNLVGNAREAGGEPVLVRATVDNGALHIEVEDAGPGFPPELAPRAFEPFVTGRIGGAGLGLAIAAAVAAAHGGDATVAVSAPGRTVVILRIPLLAWVGAPGPADPA